jgi:hypothetical protein
MSTVPVGTRVIGVWGAMFPEDHGTVVGHTDKGVPLIEWDEWCESPGQHQYEVDKGPSANGSTIGVWTREGLQAARMEIRRRNEAQANGRVARVMS